MVSSTALDSRPVPIRDGTSLFSGIAAVVALTGEQSREVARARRRRREVEKRLKKDRSPSERWCVGGDSPESSWETSNNTLLAHDSLYPGTPSLDPSSSTNRSIYSCPTFSAFIRRSVDGRGHFYFHFSRSRFRRQLLHFRER